MGWQHGEMGRRRGGLGEMEHKPKTNLEQSDGGLGEMGLDDREREKNENEKGRKRRSWRERKRKKI